MVPSNSAPNGSSPGRNEMVLFWASFFTLIAAGMAFSIRNDVLVNWGREFGFTQTQLGEITGMGLFGFGLTIIFFSFFTDLVGYGPLMVVAFLLHAFAVVVTLAAPMAFNAYGSTGAYWCLYIGAFSFSLGNGTCEAVINPLTATLFPRNKTHWLNILHAGWPGGLVLGALCSLALNQMGNLGWQIKWGIVMAPVVLYGAMMLGRRFPRSEASKAGVDLPTMLVSVLSPVLLFLFLMHALVGYVELGTDSWIIDITKTVLANQDLALIAFIWTNVLMFTLRFFAGPIVHKISPLGLLFVSALLGTLGLWMLGLPATNTAVLWLVAVTIYGIGKTFYWPTLLGVISERYPKGGAVALGLSGGIGMISAGLLGGPVIGYLQDFAATEQLREASDPTYNRYRVEKPGPSPVPVLLPPVAGLDNGRVGVLDNYEAIRALEQAKEKEGKSLTPEQRTLTLETDLRVLEQQGRTNPELVQRMEWWKTEGQPNAGKDFPFVTQARLEGGKSALAWTAAVPAALALGFLLLIVYFRMVGGYKAEVLVGHAAEDEKFTGGTMGPGEG